MSRPKGLTKTGGRKPGSKNKRTRAVLGIVDQLIFEDKTPVQHLTDVMLNPAENPERRDRAAIALLPFVHPRLTASATVTKRIDGADAEFARLFAQIEQRLALAPASARADVIDMLRDEEG
jgi:hypothetical protein